MIKSTFKLPLPFSSPELHWLLHFHRLLADNGERPAPLQMDSSGYTEDKGHVQGSAWHSDTEQRWNSRLGKGLSICSGGPREVGSQGPPHLDGDYCAPCSMGMGLNLR